MLFKKFVLWSSVMV